MAPNLLFPSSNSEDTTNQPTTPRNDFAESSLVNDIIESFIVNVEYYFGEADVDFFKDPPTLIGSKRMSLKANNVLSSSVVRAGKTAGSPTMREYMFKDTSESKDDQAALKEIRAELKSRSNQSSSVTSGNSNTPKHQCPPVPAQRTPVPKPRGSKGGYGKSNPPPRPGERPKDIADDDELNNSQQLSSDVTKL